MYLDKECFYFTEEQRGILCSAIHELERSPYITEETFNKAENILYYLCEGVEPEDDGEAN